MNNLAIYATEQTTENKKLQFLFESIGERTIIKAVEFAPIQELSGRTIYNFGFGDFDEGLGTIIDDVNSNNGDMRIVFNTVLSTVPLFFDINPEAVIIVSGSDSHNNFIKDCLPNCRKKCFDYCKNYQRQIKTYRYFDDKNFDFLSLDYLFFGRNKSGANTFVQYIPYQEYDDILVYKKK